MRLASRPNGQFTGAASVSRGDTLVCPVCSETLIVRQGLIRAPHFAHRAGSSCGWVSSHTGRVPGAVDDGQLTLFDTSDQNDPAPALGGTRRVFAALRRWWDRRR